MLSLLAPYADISIVFNLFRYLTFRGCGALLSAMIISFLLGPWLIAKLKSLQHGMTTIREDVPENHLAKRGTPTMGGFLMLASSSLAILLWADVQSPLVWIVLLLFWGFGIIGCLDDLRKIQNRSKGLSVRLRLSVEIPLALLGAWIYTRYGGIDYAQTLPLPFFKNVLLDLGFFYVPFAAVMVVSCANAVNLTDGLDGLATGPLIAAAGCFGLIAYLCGNAIFAQHLNIIYVPGAGELGVICAALVGSCLGFLWFNAPPARVFMGDTGALAMGAAIGTVSMITKHEIVLALVGGVFVVEAVSVMVQVASFRLTGKRVFAIAPLHHHFEKRGWSEPTIVIRFWIFSILFALLGLATLKLR